MGIVSIREEKSPYEQARECKILHKKNAQEIRKVIHNTEAAVTKIMDGLRLLKLPIIKHPYLEIEKGMDGIEKALHRYLLALDLQADKHEQLSKDYGRKAMDANMRLYKAVETMVEELK